ncbi:hypothetical protein [Sphingomonas quercus]|uniref:Secreted protein n=1 Tax=Sphingomonas quercus TaxID=2842451 RepID=A0ABS6BGZ3_9SPHN|nr:hypothetical protein [Sphingomonas quercus]MBU3077449.1 hypothetical protein [Sphingomonas quercus]
MITLSNSIRRAIIISAISLVPAAGMAQAATAHASAAATAAIVGNDTAASDQQVSDGGSTTRAKVYCTGRTASGDANITGSILKRKVCKTREQWLAEGVKIEDGK